ncbi:nucleotidyltransferase family protein [Mesobacterium pallidum]|uniref:nucleotidyltransferase family protein n=1 Tax=Mesobacterium pallidum TaxID=2872037 RepID=UPI001EE17DAC|nr:NTP transferase domain-containing protein [Mesobacterium pallidum]
MNEQILILIPAAGRSSRMGGTDKLMERVGDTPLLARQVARALATGAQVLVTLNSDFPARATALPPGAATALIPDAAEGLAASLRAGARHARAMTPRPTALMVLLPDLPDLTTDDLDTLLTAHAKAPDHIHQATAADGTPGHPVIFPAHLFAEFAGLTGDQGAKPLMQCAKIHHTALPGTHATRDLDTPEAWAAWRAENPAP